MPPQHQLLLELVRLDRDIAHGRLTWHALGGHGCDHLGGARLVTPEGGAPAGLASRACRTVPTDVTRDDSRDVRKVGSALVDDDVDAHRVAIAVGRLTPDVDVATLLVDVRREDAADLRLVVHRSRSGSRRRRGRGSRSRSRRGSGSGGRSRSRRGNPDTVKTHLPLDDRQILDLDLSPGPNPTARDGLRERSCPHLLNQLHAQHDASAEVASRARCRDLAEQLDPDLPLAHGLGVTGRSLLLELGRVGLAGLDLLALALELGVGRQDIVDVSVDRGRTGVRPSVHAGVGAGSCDGQECTHDHRDDCHGEAENATDGCLLHVDPSFKGS